MFTCPRTKSIAIPGSSNILQCDTRRNVWETVPHLEFAASIPFGAEHQDAVASCNAQHPGLHHSSISVSSHASSATGSSRNTVSICVDAVVAMRSKMPVHHLRDDVLLLVVQACSCGRETQHELLRKVFQRKSMRECRFSS